MNLKYGFFEKVFVFHAQGKLSVCLMYQNFDHGDENAKLKQQIIV